MQPVVGQIFFQKSLLVDHRAEVVEIRAVIGRRRAVALQPLVQLQNLLRRPLRKKLLRLLRVVVHRQDRRIDHLDSIGAG